MTRVLVNENCKDAVLNILKTLSADLEMYNEALKNLQPLVDSGYDNGEVEQVKKDIDSINDYINALVSELDKILTAYFGMDNAYARRLMEDRTAYLDN